MGVTLSGDGVSLIPAEGSGTVTEINVSGAGITASPSSPIETIGTLSVQWNGGSVAAVGGGLNINSGTIVIAENSAALNVENTTTVAMTGSVTIGAGVTGIHFAMTGGGPGAGGIANSSATTASGSTGVYLDGWAAVNSGEVLTYSVGGFGPGGAAGNNNGTPGGDTVLVGSFGTVTAKGGVASAGSASGNGTVPTPVAIILASKPTPSPTLVLSSLFNIGGGLGTAGVGGTTGNTNHPWAINGAGGSLVAGVNATGFGGSGGGAGGILSGALPGGNGSGGKMRLAPAN